MFNIESEKMRGIKFRGKRLDNGEWLYGNLVELRNPFNPNDAPACFIMPKDVNIAAPDSIAEREVVDPDTVSQFTGLHDKSGKEIYEGDIVVYDAGGLIEVSYCKGGGFAGFDLSPAFTDDNRLSDVLIIGNIQDNPELLNQ